MFSLTEIMVTIWIWIYSMIKLFYSGNSGTSVCFKIISKFHVPLYSTLDIHGKLLQNLLQRRKRRRPPHRDKGPDQIPAPGAADHRNEGQATHVGRHQGSGRPTLRIIPATAAHPPPIAGVLRQPWVPPAGIPADQERQDFVPAPRRLPLRRRLPKRTAMQRRPPEAGGSRRRRRRALPRRGAAAARAKDCAALPRLPISSANADAALTRAASAKSGAVLWRRPSFSAFTISTSEEWGLSRAGDNALPNCRSWNPGRKPTLHAEAPDDQQQAASGATAGAAATTPASASANTAALSADLPQNPISPSLHAGILKTPLIRYTINERSQILWSCSRQTRHQTGFLFIYFRGIIINHWHYKIHRNTYSRILWASSSRYTSIVTDIGKIDHHNFEMRNYYNGW